MLLKELDVKVEDRLPERRGGLARSPERRRSSQQSSSVKSAVRALEVIELFSVYREPLSVNAVSEVLNIPQSSASTLLKSLNRAGFIDRDPRSRRYMPACAPCSSEAGGTICSIGRAVCSTPSIASLR